MMSMAEQLRELKEEISDQKFTTVVLGSLPESYDNFISSLNARKVEELNWDNIKGLLMEECVKRKEKREKQSLDSSQNEALFSRSGYFLGRGRYQQRGGRYRGSNYRQSTYQGQSQRTDHGQGPKCFKCQQIGHIVKNCPLNNQKHNQSNVAEENTGSKQQDGEIALNSTLTNSKQSNQWFIDSGATKHMTFQKELIVDYIKYKQPSKIYLGDNRVINAYGEGKVRLQCYSESDVVTLVLNKVLYVCTGNFKEFVVSFCYDTDGGRSFIR